MPNWVRNSIVVSGKRNDLDRFLDAVRSDESDFDFNKIIPMPKTLEITYGSSHDEDIYWFLSDKGNLSVEAVRKKQLSKLIHNHFSANYLSDVAKRVNEIEEKPSYEMGAQLVQNYILYGATTWYDWRISNWGTKWNTSEPFMYDYGDCINFDFDTAWNAPTEIFKKLCSDFPNLKMNGAYADEDIGNNCGEWENINGIFDLSYIDTVEFACKVWGYDPDEYDY